MLVDIDIPAGNQIIHVMRTDGSSTLSVPDKVFEFAMKQYDMKVDAISRDFAADAILRTVQGND